jgi:hypothetical protein
MTDKMPGEPEETDEDPVNAELTKEERIYTQAANVFASIAQNLLHLMPILVMDLRTSFYSTLRQVCETGIEDDSMSGLYYYDRQKYFETRDVAKNTVLDKETIDTAAGELEDTIRKSLCKRGKAE